jgi:hypothetical protein
LLDQEIEGLLINCSYRCLIGQPVLTHWTHYDAGWVRSMMLLSPLVNEKSVEPPGTGDC